MLREQTSPRDELRAVERPLASVLDQVLPTLAYDEHLICIDANEACDDLFGGPREELLIGQGVTCRVHPDDLDRLARGINLVTADHRRAYPAIDRIVRPNGEVVAVGAIFRHVSPPVDGVAYLLSIYPASHTYAMNQLVDSLYSGNAAESLACAVAAVESTGHYRASVHHTAGFTGLGRFDVVVHGDIGTTVDTGTVAIERAVREAARTGTDRLLPLAVLGLPDQVDHAGLRLRGVAVIPLRVLDVIAGALVVWTEQNRELGPYGLEYVERVAVLTGLAFGQELERQARSATRTVGDLEIDLVERTVVVDGRVVKLTPIETTIVALLSEFPGRPVSRERIVEQLFGSTYVGESRAADVHIKNLRVKLGDDPAVQRWIVTMRGVGYALRPS